MKLRSTLMLSMTFAVCAVESSDVVLATTIPENQWLVESASEFTGKTFTISADNHCLRYLTNGSSKTEVKFDQMCSDQQSQKFKLYKYYEHMALTTDMGLGDGSSYYEKGVWTAGCDQAAMSYLTIGAFSTGPCTPSSMGLYKYTGSDQNPVYFIGSSKTSCLANINKLTSVASNASFFEDFADKAISNHCIQVRIKVL